MNKKSGSGAGLFMMEMILVVFFFILCASTCILVFVKANNMSRLAKDMNQGVISAESIAEVWKAEGTEGLIYRLGAQMEDETTCSIVWDKDWKVVKNGQTGSYQAAVTLSAEDELQEAAIKIVRVWDQEVLFDMTAANYRPIEQ